MAQAKKKTATKTAKKTTRPQARKKACAKTAKQCKCNKTEKIHVYVVTAMGIVTAILLCANAAMMMV